MNSNNPESFSNFPQPQSTILAEGTVGEFKKGLVKKIKSLEVIARLVGSGSEYISLMRRITILKRVLSEISELRDGIEIVLITDDQGNLELGFKITPTSLDGDPDLN